MNYDPAPSKTQQTSASWLARKFHAAPQRPPSIVFVCSQIETTRGPVLPGLFQVPCGDDAQQKPALMWFVVVTAAAIKAVVEAHFENVKKKKNVMQEI